MRSGIERSAERCCSGGTDALKLDLLAVIMIIWEFFLEHLVNGTMFIHGISMWGWPMRNRSLHTFSSPKSYAWTNAFWARNLAEWAQWLSTPCYLLPADWKQVKNLRSGWSAVCLLGHHNIQFKIRSTMQVLNEIPVANTVPSPIGRFVWLPRCVLRYN